MNLLFFFSKYSPLLAVQYGIMKYCSVHATTSNKHTNFAIPKVSKFPKGGTTPCPCCLVTILCTVSCMSTYLLVCRHRMCVNILCGVMRRSSINLESS